MHQNSIYKSITKKQLAAFFITLLFGLVFGINHLYATTSAEANPYVDNQVLVSGYSLDVEQVIQIINDRMSRGKGARGAAETSSTSLTQQKQIRLDQFSIPSGKSAPRASAADPGGSSDIFVINQYKLESGMSVEDMVNEIKAEAEMMNLDINPEPNYRTYSPYSVASKPWSVGSGPWSVGSGPWSVGSGPWSVGSGPWSVGSGPWSVGSGPSGQEVLDAMTELFAEQWAFDNRGIDLSSYRRAGGSVTGNGVRVGVFDTSPFPVTVQEIVFSMPDRMNLKLKHPLPGGYRSPDSVNLSDHGLFVAGLIHGVAPGSDIQLVRVLDDSGTGDLYTLNTALVEFIVETVQDHGTLSGAIMNLSLGLIPGSSFPGPGGIPPEVHSLNHIITLAKQLGIATIAAAGNESGDPNIPATWSNTLGVSSSNVDKNLSCFSNTGDVMAPGGDGAMPGCVQVLTDCDGYCEYALVSLAFSSELTGFSYWNGTSFATPLVSGLAALLFESSGQWPAVDNVFHHIMMNTSAEGVVNVDGSLPF